MKKLLPRMAPQWKTLLAALLLINFLCACASVLSDSENFYRDRPRRPINWREILTD
jgi:hypothetical protein